MITPQDSHHMVSHDWFSQIRTLSGHLGIVITETFLFMVYHMNEAVTLIFVKMGSKLKCCLKAMETRRKKYFILYQHYPVFSNNISIVPKGSSYPWVYDEPLGVQIIHLFISEHKYSLYF